MKPMRFCYYTLIFFFLTISKLAIGQEKSLTFNKENVANILQAIEKESNWIFNYNPQILSDYTFNGELKKGNIETQLSQLFYRAPFTFEVNDHSILV